MADIFRIITINTARHLNMENEIGSIQRDEVADIILLLGNPLGKHLSLGNHPKPAIHNHLKTGQR